MWWGTTRGRRDSVATLLGLLALALAALALAGCGSGGDEELTAKQASRRVVLSVSELPGGTTVAKKPILGETCSPASYFRPYAAAVAVTPGFYLPQGALVQQVGIFDSTAEAKKAFREITSDGARNCITHQLQLAAVSYSGTKGRVLSEDPPRGTTDATSRTVSLELVSLVGSVYVERTALLDGRGLTTLTFISRELPLSAKEWRGAADSATASLGDAVGALAS
jgi:hypothetical protein